MRMFKKQRSDEMRKVNAQTDKKKDTKVEMTCESQKQIFKSGY